jgi:hypothetical protein
MKRILVLIVAISAIAVFAGHVFGQVNTGSAPYRDSEHTYEISIGKESNRREWILTDGTTSYNLSTTSYSWATIAAVSGGKQRIAIFFDRTVFTTDNWNLQYFEYDMVAGVERCTSARQFAITLVNNSFVLALSGDLTTCNSQSGQPHTYEEVDTESFNTTVTYTVTMTKDDAFKPTFWKFDAQFSQNVQSIAVNSTTTNPGTISYTPSTVPGANYTIQVNPVNASPASVVLNIVVQFSNPIHAAVTPTLTVSNGLAVVQNPPNPEMTTQDNITVVDGGLPVRTQIITINAIPESRDIVPGVDETTWSASNPLQNSTHKYSVQVGALGNTYEWTVLNSDQSPLAAASNYTLSPTDPTGAETNALVSITYLPAMSTGLYFVQFKETAATGGCSTIRRYPITLGGPFDVDIVASELTTCAAISGQINNSPGTETVTTVQYEVELKNSTYVGNWKFDLGFTSAPGFNADLDLVSGGISLSSGGTLSGSTVTVVNTDALPLRKVTVTVQYTGFYSLAHNITATLTNITGSYAEQDADGTNETTHTIYAMPQAGTLAGVD